MQPTICSRLYDRLDDLIPNLSSLRLGNAFYAPPKVAGDISLYCAVSRTDEGVIELELAHDHLVAGKDQPAPCIVFRIDTARKEAELLAVQDEGHYEVIYSKSDRPDPRRQAMNLFAVNWLTHMLSLNAAFRPVPAPSAAMA